ncbi:MAG: cupredoxin domain-containing protein [Gaiellaceae bacterium]
MRMLKYLLVAVAALMVAAPAQAATTVAVKITKTGFAPTKVTINAGDSVKWTNNDTVNRQIVATGGQFASPVLRPNQTYTRVFNTAGTYAYRDVFKTDQRGTVVVKGPPPSISLAAAQPIITYGQTVVVSGRVSSGKAGEEVIVYQKPYGQVSYAELAKVLTATDGYWSYTVQPALLTYIQAKWKNLSSVEISVAVSPKLTLKRIGSWFVVRVDAARSFKNRWVYIQRRSALGQWVNLRKVVIGTATAQRFKLKVPVGLSRLRVFMTVNQAGVGYLASQSNTFLFRQR